MPAVFFRPAWSSTPAATLLLSLLAVALIAVAGTARPSVANAQSVSTVFVEGKSSAVGDHFTTEVNAILPPGTTIVGFTIALSFDDRAVRPLRQELPQGWSETPSTPGADPAMVRISASTSESTCTGPGSCLLSTVAWEALSAGDSQVAIAGVELHSSNGPVPVSSTSAGQIHIPPGVAASNSLEGSADLGLAYGAATMALVLFAGTAAALPLVIALRRRRIGRGTLAAPGPVNTRSLNLADTAAAYFSELELAGRVFAEPDRLVEKMAEETAVRGSSA